MCVSLSVCVWRSARSPCVFPRLALHLAIAMGTARQILYQPLLGIEGARQVSERPAVWNTLLIHRAINPAQAVLVSATEFINDNVNVKAGF